MASPGWSTHRIPRDGSSSKINMCVSLQRRAIKNLQMYLSLHWRVQKCMKQVSDVHGTSRHTKIIVSPQFWRFDDHEVTKRLPVDVKHARFATVSDVRPARSDESVRGRTEKFACHHSFERPSELQKLLFTTVLSVRRSLFSLRLARGTYIKFAFHHSFERPTSTKWREGWFPIESTKPTLRKKNRRAAFLSSFSQQPFSAGFLSSSSQQPFSAATRSSHPQLSSCCGQGLVVSY